MLDVFAPPPRLAIVGAGELADALGRQGDLLGWAVSVTSGLDTALPVVADLWPALSSS